MRRSILIFFFSTSLLLSAGVCHGQYLNNDTTLSASKKYNKSNFYTFFWGKHYRREWATSVLFKKVNLDTLAGGLVPYQAGGGRQSNSIRVTDKDKREYVFRSIDKSFSKALPHIAQHTFIETIANDQVTIAHPYAGTIVAPLAKAAHIYHPAPVLYFVPKQKALGIYNDSAGDILYSFEQRPDENWETADNFGNSKKIISTDKMLEKILEDNDNAVDQRMFAKCRLFDMLIGDWGRHEDQWRWASFKEGKKTLYQPIPRDRDNAFTKFDGLLLKILIPAANARHLQTFDYKIKNVDRFNFPARNLDHHLLNEVTKEEWISIAKELQNELTDQVIENAVMQMPAEVYPASGKEITAKLKRRKNDLIKYAIKYYQFLAKDVEITGTKKDEYFEVKRISAKETEVSIYKIAKKENINNKPFYHRVFKTTETHEIRLYGIAGNDEYVVSGNVKKGIKVRLIGGIGKDKYSDQSRVAGLSHKTKIYDNPGNDISSSKETERFISTDTTINQYNYRYFNYNRKALAPTIFYNNDDRVYAGISFSTKKYKWRKYPFANTQYLDVKYSLSQKGFSSTYAASYADLIGKWQLSNYLNYDEVRWTNFYGLGNTTVLQTKERDYFRMRNKEFNAAIGINRVFNNRHKITIDGFYQDYKILSDTDRFIAKQFTPGNTAIYNTNDFAGIKVGYVYQLLNDSILPVKGISFGVNGSYTNDLRKTTGNVAKYNADITWYAPLTKRIGLVIRGGAATLTGTPYFFQYNTIGGSETIRGYQRDRFYGNSTVYTQNELRWITDVRSYIFNGKIGFFGLYDAGRVWLKGENSNRWHAGYGGGILLSVFNRLTVSAAYAFSPEDQNFHFRIVKFL